MNEIDAKSAELSTEIDLRQQAESRLNEAPAQSDPCMSEAEVRSLVHELQVHRIELEMQNEELLRAQAAAQDASEKYYNLFDFAPVGYFLWDHEGRIAEVNLAGAKLLGLDRNAAVGTSFGQFLAVECRQAFADFRQRVLSSDTKQTCEVKLLGGRQPLDILIEGIAAHERAGQEGRLCRAAVIDITEQKRAAVLATQNKELQEAQRRAEMYRDRYVDLYDNAPLGYVTFDEDGYIQEINLAGAKLLGVPRDELAGYEFSNYVVADHRRAFLDHIRNCCRERAELTCEVDLLANDGRTITVQVHSLPIAQEGHEGTFCKTAMTDITLRKQAEEKLRESMRQREFLASVIETAAQPFGVAFADGRLGVVNKAFERLTGYSTEELQTIDWFHTLTPPEWQEAELKHIAELVCTGQPVRFEKEYVRKDGTRVPVELLIHVVRDAAGQPECFYSFITDLTDRKRITGELQHAKAVAEAANVAKSQFLANMSHELRTPMNAILGMIDVALPKANDPRVLDCLQTAKGSADLLLTLLNNLLDSAKVESGKLELEAAPFSVRRMLDQVKGILTMRACEKGLSFNCRVPEGTPDAVIGDRIRLQQVLLNLAENAIKFTERGEVEIAVLAVDGLGMSDRCGRRDWGLADEPHNDTTSRANPIPNPQSPIPSISLEFSVRDTGMGIPPASLERLFQPFVQADPSMTRQFGGTGLGLSICKNLVELMGGCIAVESEVGKGSTFSFTVRLPVTKDLPYSPDTEALPPACASLHILLVEDNPANQKLATYFLQDRGHRIDIAGDGCAAIAMSQQTRYDVILMDVQMPEMDGLDATRAIRKNEGGGRRAPILAMTAHALASDRDRCLAAGMDAYISKPVNRRELIETVERMGNTGWARIDWEPTMGDDAHPVLQATTTPSAPDSARLKSQPHPAIPRPHTAIAAAMVFNFDEAMELVGGEPRILEEMVGHFYGDGFKTLREIETAAAAGDAQTIEAKAHFLKGTVSHLAAAAALQSIAHVESLGRSGNLQGIGEAVGLLKSEMLRLGAALRPYVPADAELS